MEELTTIEELKALVLKQSQQIEALENQAYILYLQLNGLTKQLIEKSVIDKDQLTKDMDELNDQLYEVAKASNDEVIAAQTDAVQVAE